MVLALNQSQQDRIFNKAKKSYFNSKKNMWFYGWVGQSFIYKLGTLNNFNILNISLEYRIIRLSLVDAIIVPIKLIMFHRADEVFTKKTIREPLYYIIWIWS